MAANLAHKRFRRRQQYLRRKAARQLQTKWLDALVQRSEANESHWLNDRGF